MFNSLGRVLGVEPVGARGAPHHLPDVPQEAKGRNIGVDDLGPVLRSPVSILVGKIESFHIHL
jgi:hypothetical protein